MEDLRKLDFPHIWLEPKVAGVLDERTWCQDNVWTEDCDYLPTKYIRSDLVNARDAEIAALRKRVAEMEDAAGKVCEALQTLASTKMPKGKYAYPSDAIPVPFIQYAQLRETISYLSVAIKDPPPCLT